MSQSIAPVNLGEKLTDAVSAMTVAIACGFADSRGWHQPSDN